jgi:hypothetical protein
MFDIVSLGGHRSWFALNRDHAGLSCDPAVAEHGVIDPRHLIDR